MENFSELIKNFCVIAISGGLIMLMSPNGRLNKHVKFIISLCMVCALLSALVSAPEAIEKYLSEMETEIAESASAGGEDARLAVAKAAKNNMESEVKNRLAERFGFGENEIYVVATLDTSDLSAVEITQISVFLADFSAADAAEKYLNELFMGEVDIVIMEKG